VASKSQSQSFITPDGQSASLSWFQVPIWGPKPDFCYCQTVAGLLMWGALSDEGMGLLFTTAAGPHQRSHLRVRVMRECQFPVCISPGTAWPSYTSRHWVPFSSPPTTRRAPVELFEPAAKQGLTTDCALANWILNCCWQSPAQRFLVPSPTGLMTLFYCLTAVPPPQLTTLCSGLSNWPPYIASARPA
jgi:hypothetical protein